MGYSYKQMQSNLSLEALGALYRQSQETNGRINFNKTELCEMHIGDNFKHLEHINFTDCELSNVLFEEVNLVNARFYNCSLVNVRFVNCYLDGAMFERCYINGAIFNGSVLDGMAITRSTVSDAVINRCSITALYISPESFQHFKYITETAERIIYSPQTNIMGLRDFLAEEAVDK